MSVEAMPPPARILVADDEPHIRQYVSDILESMPNVDVRLVASGEEAVRAISEGEWDLVITDQRMGGTDGIAVLQWAAARAPATGRIMMTGYAELPLVEVAKNLGHVQRFLAKPFGPDDLRAQVGALLDSVRRSSQRRAAFDRAQAIAKGAAP